MSRMSPKKKKSRALPVVLTALFLAVTVGAGFLAASLDRETLAGFLAPIADPLHISSSQTSSFGGASPNGREPDGQGSDEGLSSSGGQESSGDVSGPDGQDVPNRPEQGEPVQQPDLPIVYRKPDQMRGVWLTAEEGGSLKAGENIPQAEAFAQADEALSQIEALSMNSIVVNAAVGDRLLYPSDLVDSLTRDYDVLEYLLTQSREKGLYTYVALPLLEEGETVSLEGINRAWEVVREFSKKYQPDGLLFYRLAAENGAEQQQYSQYLADGGAMGGEKYFYELSQSLLETAAAAVREGSRQTQVGVLSPPVWANRESREDGSNTASDYEMYYDSTLDLRELLRQGLFDFVMVETPGSLTDEQLPFEEVVSWWSAVGEEVGIPVYPMQASDRAGSTEYPGWSAPDELTKQVIAAKNYSSYGGSVFSSLAALVSNPGNSTETLIGYLNETVKAEHILTRLDLTSPEKNQFSTFEPEVTFAGASDPNFPVSINGEEITTDQNGYFSVSLSLQAGANQFVITHKDQRYVYDIFRQVQIFREVTPEGSITVDGGMQITVTAMAYADAQVSASLGGQTIALTLSEQDDDETDRTSNYRKYVGTFTAPAATSSAQNLGNIVFSASWSGVTDSKQGASVKVNKKAVLGSGVLAQIKTAQAETFPTNQLNDLSQPGCYPLPLGTMDYLVGDEIVYKQGSATYKYYKLNSDKRVYADDLTPITSVDSIEDNQITGMKVQSNTSYTAISLDTKFKVPFTVTYDSSSVRVKFFYTVAVPEGMSISKSPLFTAASWSGDTLVLSLRTANGFLGFTSYYDEQDRLVLRFNNPGPMASIYSLSGARIVIDPGHSIGDPGALGFLKNYPEQVINYAITSYLKEILQDRGATVKMIDTQSSKISLESRVSQTEAFEPHLFLSIHNNSSPDSSGAGTEVYYFNSFSSQLASYISQSVSSALNTANRGGKFGRYYVTRTSRYPAVLVECGFVTNQREYEKLIQADAQYEIAEAIADGIARFMQATGSLENTGGGGEEIPEPGVNQVGGSSTSGSNASGGEVDNSGSADINFDQPTATIAVGESIELPYTTEKPNQSLDWRTADASIAKVSQSGVVTGVSPGTVKISVWTADEAYADKCFVTVTAEGDTREESDNFELSFDQDELAMELAGVDYLPVWGAGDRELRWSSSDSSIISVDADGRVEAKGIGTATVSVRFQSGLRSARFEITVYPEGALPDDS